MFIIFRKWLIKTVQFLYKHNLDGHYMLMNLCNCFKMVYKAFFIFINSEITLTKVYLPFYMMVIIKLYQMLSSIQYEHTPD